MGATQAHTKRTEEARHGGHEIAGVLFKNAEAIEVMRKVNTLVVDKTGR